MSPKSGAPLKMPASIQRPATVDRDAAFEALERRTEMRGNGVAGQPLDRDAQVDVRMDVLKQTSGKAVVKRRGGRLRRRRTIYLPTDLDAGLERFCAASGREVSETVAAALELYLASKR